MADTISRELVPGLHSIRFKDLPNYSGDLEELLKLLEKYKKEELPQLCSGTVLTIWSMIP